MIFLIIVLIGLLGFGTTSALFVPLLLLGGIVFALQFGALFRRSELITFSDDTLAIANDLAAALFVLLLCALLLGQVMAPGRVTTNRIIGAVTVYLLSIVLFALLFNLLERLSPGAFAFGSQPLRLSPTGGRFFYLSVITATTVGFGDITPVHSFARSLVMIEALFGHIYTAVLLARLVSLEVAYRISASSAD